MSGWRRSLILAIVMTPFAFGQSDPLLEANKALQDATGKKLSFTVEERTRWEEKYGVNFGKAVNQQDMLSRVRVGLQFTPSGWLAVYAMAQDSRAPVAPPARCWEVS